MAYSELIKSFDRIRGYMREFFVYGFKSRSEYDVKSARSYDNERRRIESWLGDYMSFRQDASGKNVFLSVDSRSVPHNPLYNAFKAKSFTDWDIYLHFVLLDMLQDGRSLTIRQIQDELVSEYLDQFPDAEEPDESTIRKKLKEYEQLGVICSRKQGRELAFSLVLDSTNLDDWKDAIAFYSEAAPLGVVGSTLLDKYKSAPDYFSFKHRYILHALDSEVLYDVLLAIRETRAVEITSFSRRKEELRHHTVFPLRIYVSTQTGRQYLLGYHYRMRRPMFFRLDSIRDIKLVGVEKHPEKYEAYYEKLAENLWGVSTGVGFSLDHLEMTIHIGYREEFIVDRLEREKRCGCVECIDKNTYKYVADIYDASEMLPWLRTFIGRIEKLECSNRYVTETFYEDLAALEKMYGGEPDVVQ